MELNNNRRSGFLLKTKVSLRIINKKEAAKAIVRLAGNIASVSAIINAADTETDVFAGIEKTHERINKLAYDAEKGLISRRRMIKVQTQINKLFALIKNRKESNPLISDELISVMKTTVDNTNTALELIMKASK